MKSHLMPSIPSPNLSTSASPHVDLFPDIVGVWSDSGEFVGGEGEEEGGEGLIKIEIREKRGGLRGVPRNSATGVEKAYLISNRLVEAIELA
jgi:hypothetical protein